MSADLIHRTVFEDAVMSFRGHGICYEDFGVQIPLVDTSEFEGNWRKYYNKHRETDG